MSDLTINKTTGISIGLILILAPAVFWGISAWTRVQAQTERNTNDITGIFGKLDELNSNLVETNGNIIGLNARLDALVNQQNTPTVTVIPTQPRVQLTVVRNTAMQPSNPQQGIQPSTPPQKETEPESPEQPPMGGVANVVQQALDIVLGVIRR